MRLKWLFILMLIAVLAFPGLAQNITSEQEVIELALQHYPTMRIAALELKEAKALERTAFNPDQPRVTVETPADIGLGLEVEQEFAFPDVYFKRAKWLKSKTQLAAVAGNLSRNEMIRDVRIAYLETQVARARFAYYTVQDSLWSALAGTSQRLYDGGDITRADLIFAQHTAGTTALEKALAGTTLQNKQRQLQLYTGSAGIEPGPIGLWEMDETDTGYYLERYYTQQLIVSENESRMLRAQRAPGIVLGYLRATEPETNYRHRLIAGLTIPIFQGQYSGEIVSSRLAGERIAHELELRQNETAVALAQWKAERQQAADAVTWYETTGLQQQASLAAINMRLFDAGEIDYALALRNTAEAIGLQNDYFDLVERHNRAVIEIDFLNGKHNE